MLIFPWRRTLPYAEDFCSCGNSINTEIPLLGAIPEFISKIIVMACAVQSYNHQLATEVAELSNELGDNGFFATIPSSLNWPITCGGVELDFLPTEEECILAPSYYQEQQLSSTLPETKSTRPASLFELPGKGWWDESELAPSVYKTLKEREQSLSKIEYRSPQLMSR